MLVFVNQATTNKQHPKVPVVYKNQVTVTMAKVGGQWLVDDLHTDPSDRLLTPAAVRPARGRGHPDRTPWPMCLTCGPPGSHRGNVRPAGRMLFVVRPLLRYDLLFAPALKC